MKRAILILGFGAFLLRASAPALCQSDTVAPMPPSGVRVVHQLMSEGSFRFASAMKIVNEKCTSCHRAGGSALNFTPYLNSEAAWAQSQLVVPESSQSSLLFKYLIGSGFSSPFGTMPLGGSLSSTELEVFRSWIDNMVDPATLPTPTPVPTVVGATYGLDPALASPRLGDRDFVKSVLDRVFGPAAAATTSSLVHFNISIFGGVYDVMSAPPATGQGGDQCSNCDAQVFMAPPVPPASTTRAGQTMKACNVLAFNDTTLQYAIKAATNRTDLSYLTVNPIPLLSEVVNAYALFGPELAAPSSAALGQLVALAETARVTTYPQCPNYNPNCELDPWRYVLLTLCYDPAWQVI